MIYCYLGLIYKQGVGEKLLIKGPERQYFFWYLGDFCVLEGFIYSLVIAKDISKDQKELVFSCQIVTFFMREGHWSKVARLL